MSFSPHMRNLFALRGLSAVYTPPGGDAISCRAVRVGGGVPIKLGTITVVVERTQFHVRRAEIASPVAGGALVEGGNFYTVEAVQPVERDSEGLLWSLDVTWGAIVTYRSVTGAGAAQNPPQGFGFSIASAALLGASAVSIRSTFTVGKLLAGDRFTITGDATSYTVTGSGVPATSNQFLGVPITPPLAGPVAQDAIVTFNFARDFVLRGAVSAYESREIAGGVQFGDRRLVLLQSAMTAAGMADEPKPGDRVVIGAKSYTVVTASAVYQHAAPAAWDVQVRS